MAAPHRNLLVVIGHGLREDVLGDVGAWPMVTPNLDDLLPRAARCSAVSACPADPGGLISLLTGLHARQHGYTLSSGKPAQCDGWPLMLAETGAHVAGAGCVGPILPHLADQVSVADPDEMDSDRCAYLSAVRDRDFFDELLVQRRHRKRSGPMDPYPLALDPADDIDGFIAQQASDLLERMPVDRPWALIVIFSGPGSDLPPPAMYDDAADPVLLEGGFVPADFTRIDALAELDYPRVALQRLTPEKIARIRADYLGRVALFDFAVGGLMNQLEQRGDAARTWTVIGSDRGCLLGEHGLVGHRSFFAGAVETPLILAPPTPARCGRADTPISTVDVAATIALLGGCDLTGAMAGRSLLPLLQDEPLFPAAPGGAALCEYGQRVMLQTDGHKVVFDVETRAAIGLFDRERDPEQRRNLIGEAEGRNVLDALRWRLGDALLGLRHGH